MEHRMRTLFTAIGITIGLFLQSFVEAAASWHWFSLLSNLMCFAFTTAAFLTALRYLHLIFIAPKKIQISIAQKLLDTADDRARAVNLRVNTLEQKTGSMKKELAQLYAERRRFKKITTSTKIVPVAPMTPRIAKAQIEIEQDY